MLFVAQSALVRVLQGRRAPRTRLFGAALTAFMIVSGFIVSIVMIRFEMTVLHLKNAASFLSFFGAT